MIRRYSEEGLPFRKMHGLGNDFVVLDARTHPVTLTDAQVRALANRRTGVGCDQLIILEPAHGKGDAFMWSGKGLQAKLA